MALEHEALTERIIGAAIEVHRRLGPGFLESVYEKALIIELKKRGMAVQDQIFEFADALSDWFLLFTRLSPLVLGRRGFSLGAKALADAFA
jgi:hypothetical protein